MSEHRVTRPTGMHLLHVPWLARMSYGQSQCFFGKNKGFSNDDENGNDIYIDKYHVTNITDIGVNDSHATDNSVWVGALPTDLSAALRWRFYHAAAIHPPVQLRPLLPRLQRCTQPHVSNQAIKVTEESLFVWQHLLSANGAIDFCAINGRCHLGTA
eukprot:scaffold281584_cov34-Prasinocladus_malaysianus.AAC.3